MSGRKTFVGGDILLASELNGFLMDQSVMVFDDASARTSAIPSPAEGMVTFLKDSNALFTYSGSAWVPAVNTASIVDGNVTNVKLGAGTIRQVVHTSFTSSTSTGSTSWTSTGLTASITPTSADSRIWAFADLSTTLHDTNNYQLGGYVLRRNNDANITSPVGNASGSRSRVSKSNFDVHHAATQIVWLDHPNTTSSTSYTVWMRMLATPGAVGLNVSNDVDSSANPSNASSLTLMEVTF